jgi:hypothetical protein
LELREKEFCIALTEIKIILLIKEVEYNSFTGYNGDLL